jgi:hypothetical protein
MQMSISKREVAGQSTEDYLRNGLEGTDQGGKAIQHCDVEHGTVEGVNG